jgi:hypothetical protein
MVGEETIMLIERLGIGAVAFYLVYVLLKQMTARNAIQADQILDLARTTISENTEALHNMSEILVNNIKQKESLVTAIHEQTTQLIAKLEGCKQSRDKQFREVLRKQP